MNRTGRSGATGVRQDDRTRALAEANARAAEMLVRLEEANAELTQAQAELVKREKHATLGQIAASMAHELRNPLAVMRNAVAFLNMAERQGLTEKGLCHLAVIDQQIERSNRIVSALLEFAEDQPPASRALPVSAVLDEALRRVPVPENVRVTTEVPADVPTIFADPEQVKTVLGNLIENAFLAMPEGGRLTITAEPKAKPAQVRIGIADTGCGIAPEHLPHLFEPLFSTRTVGVGLGLAVCRKLVEANHGSISVESEPGKGSLFTVTLPAVSSK